MVAEYVRDTFCWPLRETSAQRSKPLPGDYPGLCPSFNLGVATQLTAGWLMWAPAAVKRGALRVLARERGTSSSSSDGSPRRSSSERASTSSLSHEGPSTLVRLVLKKRGCSPVRSVPKIVAEGPKFPRAPAHSDPQDGSGSHFPNPKVVPTLKRTTLEKKYLLPVGYTFMIPEPDATVNEPPAKCIVVYCATLNYGLRFPFHPVTEDILTKYELAPAQVVPTSWHSICSFIATCELRGLTYLARAFNLVHIVHSAPKKTRDLGCYCFNNRSGYMTAIEKKSKTIQPVKGSEKRVSEDNINGLQDRGRHLEVSGGQSRLSSGRGATVPCEPARQEGTYLSPACPNLFPREPADTLKTARAASQVASGTSPSARPLPPNVIMVNLAAKFTLVQDLVKSWDLATSGTSDPLKVTEDEVIMAEPFARGVRAAMERRRLEGLVTRYQRRWETMKEEKDAREAEKKDLQHQLEEALPKAEAEATAGAERAAQARE
ncbi:hypothetical protein Cgig2_015629 [Carnegiea gigantea]|uniref:Transposase (putative) gypsy type domain-containing protein n=1 Tax=Carnegiea gigantea TaxID=171969 RepID=A0A9Q1JRY8_9CARY|nr:hypothetical protein Cgig2_015629 [Carnegiea gigantea]